MCLTEAGPVTSVTATEAVVDLDGVARVVSLAPLVLDGRTVEVGDWVLVHTGLAMDVVDEAAGAEMAAFSRLVRGTQEVSD